MFNGCVSLESLDLSKMNTSLVRSMKFMFKDCVSLKTLDLSNFNTSNLESVEGMFFNASSLVGLDFSSFNQTPIRVYNYMLEHCYSLFYVNIFPFKDCEAFYIYFTSPLVKNITFCVDKEKAPANTFLFNNNNFISISPSKTISPKIEIGRASCRERV